jgi:hypothetical protein
MKAKLFIIVLIPPSGIDRFLHAVGLLQVGDMRIVLIPPSGIDRFLRGPGDGQHSHGRSVLIPPSGIDRFLLDKSTIYRSFKPTGQRAVS